MNGKIQNTNKHNKLFGLNEDDYKHLTTAELSKLSGIADNANNYVHPNHSGDVTSVADGATTIADEAVTLAKMADMATASLIYRKTAGTGVPEVNTLATLKTDLTLVKGDVGLGSVDNTSDATKNAASVTLTNKTIDADNNTVSNIEVDNLKTGVLDTDISSVSASDDTLASAKAIKTAIDNIAIPLEVDGAGFSIDNGSTRPALGTKAVDLSYTNNGTTGATGDYSLAEGLVNTASGDYSHAEGYDATASANYAHAEGTGTTASGEDAHAEGKNTTASGGSSHAEGRLTTASNSYAHAEGYDTTASNAFTHAEGYTTLASGSASHAEGRLTIADGDYSHSQGYETTASTQYAHAEGYRTSASNGLFYTVTAFDNTLKTLTLDSVTSLAVGNDVTIINVAGTDFIDVEITDVTSLTITLDTTETLTSSCDYVTKKNSNLPCHAEGRGTVATGSYSHAEGFVTVASGQSSHAEGQSSKATGNYSHAEGVTTTASESGSHAEGTLSTSSGSSCHAEGYGTTASASYCHAEGQSTTASGTGSHSEGLDSVASGNYSHAEGYGSIASGDYGSHAEGQSTTAATDYAHAEGKYTLACSGVLYTITAFDNTAKTITLDNVSGLAVGNFLTIKFTSGIAIEDLEITDITALVVTLDTALTITSAWDYAIEKGGVEYVTHAEGENTIASGNYSHVEGVNCIASGGSSHAEGQGSVASGAVAHSEGLSTIASASRSHAEGQSTTASGSASHAEGYNTISSGNYSHAEGSTTTASSQTSHAEGYLTTSSGNNGCHAEGNETQATASYAHSQGYRTMAATAGSHAEGQYTLACHSTLYTISAFDNTAKTITLDNVSGLAVGNYLTIKISDSIAVEDLEITDITALVVTLDTAETITSSWLYAMEKQSTQYPCHAEGKDTLACGYYSHAQGFRTIASGSTTHAEGQYCESTGAQAHSEGQSTIASGSYSHAQNRGNTAQGYCQTAMGVYNTLQGTAGSLVTTDNALIIGNGTATGSRGNAFYVRYDGEVYSDGAYNGTGADYAEYFEWLDGNISEEDRRGHFVTLDGNKIRKANSTDNYILGIVSANPSIVGDSDIGHWKERYLTDEWGKRLTQMVTYEAEYETRIIPAEYDEEGNIITEETAEIILISEEHTNEEFIQNPNYNPDTEYTPRANRPEWSAIGMMGKLLVRDDGTCQVNSYCKSNDDGIATASTEGYRVMERVSANIIKVLVK